MPYTGCDRTFGLIKKGSEVTGNVYDTSWAGAEYFYIFSPKQGSKVQKGYLCQSCLYVSMKSCLLVGSYGPGHLWKINRFKFSAFRIRKIFFLVVTSENEKISDT